MTAPSGNRDDATIRGAVVLVVAIVIGLALLARGGGGGDDEADATTTTRASGDTTTTDVTGATQSTLPPIDGATTTTLGTGGTQPPDMVAVMILNGTPDRIPNIASEFGDKAEAAGYENLAPTNANTPTDTTTIYFAPGFEADATAMKGVLGLPTAAIAAKPDESLGAGDELADIVAVLGGDYAG